jgi:hypothetical protein
LEVINEETSRSLSLSLSLFSFSLFFLHPLVVIAGGKTGKLLDSLPFIYPSPSKRKATRNVRDSPESLYSLQWTLGG